MVRVVQNTLPVKWYLAGEMMTDTENEFQHKTFRMLADRVCLDFANTVGDHATDHPSEYLDGYADLVLWAQQAGILSELEADALYILAGKHLREAATAFELSLTLRETIFRIFSAIAAG